MLFLKDCEGALLEVKPKDMIDVAWMKLNKTVITCIKINEILVDLQKLTSAFEILEKLKATYEITTPINQVHLMGKLLCMQLDESKSVVEHLSIFTCTLS